MTEQIVLLKEVNLSEFESIFASYSISELGFDPIDVLQGLWLSSEEGMRFEPKHSIRDSLRSGLRLGFPVLHPGHHLDSYSGMLQVSDMWICVVPSSRKSNCNNAKLVDGVPHDRNSLIGIVHRVLVNAGENPTWIRRESVYSNILGQGDCLEVIL